MEIEKNYRINSLFEFYEPLLTNKQKAYIQLYYADDYSLLQRSSQFRARPSMITSSGPKRF